MSPIDARMALLSDFRGSLLPTGVIALGMCLTTAIVSWDGENPSLINEILLCLLAFARAVALLTLVSTWLRYLKRSKTRRCQ
jgi:hypothetical protein